MKALSHLLLFGFCLALVPAAALAQGAGARCVVGRHGQPVLIGTVPVSISALLSQYPGGGTGLTQAVADLLVNHPGAAADIVAIGNRAGPEQKAAIAAGIADALAQMAEARSANGRVVNAAMRCADANLRATVAVLNAQHYAEGNHGSVGHLPPIFVEGGAGFGAGGGGPASPN